MESYQGGFSSSALATRHGFALDQAYGIYLTDKRLIVTKEKSTSGIGWDINVSSLFGSFSDKVNPSFDPTPRTIEAIDTQTKKLDVSIDQIHFIELKRPSFFSKGHIAVSTKSGESFKLLLLESPEDYGKESFEAAKELFQKRVPHILRIA